MVLNGKITLLINRDGITIHVRDDNSRVEFLQVELDRGQSLDALSRLAETDCSIVVRGLDKVGKIRENSKIVFKMPEYTRENKKEVAYKESLKNCPEGWEVIPYFDSQDSFYRDTNNNEMARAMIVRYLDVGEN